MYILYALYGRGLYKMKLEELCEKFFRNDLQIDGAEADCLKRALCKFCATGKKEDAFSVYYCFCEIFKVFGSGYGSMNRLLEFLSDHELHSGELLTKHRDHYSHSVYVFALGIAIYANDPSYRDLFLDFYRSEKADDTDFLYRWGLTALFHDIGYPFQLAHEQIKDYTGGLWGANNPSNPFVSYENMESLLSLSGESVNGKRSAPDTVTELLARGINRRLGYPVPVLRALLTERYRHQNQFMDHGYFSAVLLCRQLVTTGTAFSDSISDVVTAIVLHNNLNRYDISRALKTKTAIPAKKHPLAYLLVLCDELQDWDRAAFGSVSKKDPLARKIELSVGDGKVDVCYVFDSFSVIDTQEETGADGGVEVREILRPNRNAEKIRSGKFTATIAELIDGNIDLYVTAREEKQHKKGTAFASSDSFINLCDFARAIHKSYQSVYGGADFDELSLEFRLSNIEQAKSYADKLESIDCFYSDKELDYPMVTKFTARGESDGEDGARDDLGFLSREEHLRWVREKLDAGWKYGTDYSSREERDAKKIHKDIVPYDCLPEEERRKDEIMIRNMVPLLYHFGHGVRIYSYRGGGKPVLDIAGCGHCTVSVKNERIREQVKEILRGYMQNYRVVVRTNFAFGAEQLIAECANELGITVKATLPLPYEDYVRAVRENAEKYRYSFTEEDECRMRHLLAQTVSCKAVSDRTHPYLEAAKYIIGRSKKLIAVWDGVETAAENDCGDSADRDGTWRSICFAKNFCGLKDGDIHIIECER